MSAEAASSDREPPDPADAERLLPLVYDELRKLAATMLAGEKPGQTLQPTALVHEAYLRLVGGPNPTAWKDRRQFFAAAAQAIRRLLIDRARRKRTTKHGGEFERREWDDLAESLAEPREDVLALDVALEKLAAEDAAAAELVQLVYFAGLTVEEAAEALGVSVRTVGRQWAFARAWLRREIEGIS